MRRSTRQRGAPVCYAEEVAVKEKKVKETRKKDTNLYDLDRWPGGQKAWPDQATLCGL